MPCLASLGDQKQSSLKYRGPGEGGKGGEGRGQLAGPLGALDVSSVACVPQGRGRAGPGGFFFCFCFCFSS